jgi:hypothetical protein
MGMLSSFCSRATEYCPALQLNFNKITKLNSDSGQDVFQTHCANSWPLPVMLEDDSATIKQQNKMNRQANASAKSKEVQRHPHADTQLHHICSCPNSQRPLSTSLYF